MKILQQLIKVKRHSRVNVHFNRPCNIYLMTETNYKRYREGGSFRRIGGKFEKSPAEFIAPHDGAWHAVIEKGGSHRNPQPIDGRVEVLPPKMKDIPYLFEPKEDSKNKEIESELKEEIIDSSEGISEDESSDDAEDEDKEEN